MKKAFLFSFGLFVALSSLFVSCSDNNGDGNGVVSCTVSATATEGGRVTIENYSGGTAVLLAGNTLVLVATPDLGYQFIGWYVGGSETPVSTDLTYSFVVSKDVAYVAKFDKTYALSVCSSGNGSVAFKDIQDSSLELLIGSDVTVVATPDEYTDFLGWFVGDNSEPVSTEATYTFTVEENVTLIAKFNKWPLVSISSGGNGSVSFENSAELSQYIQIGEELTVVATPNEKCEFIGWFIGDSETAISTEATYTFTVEENVSLVAKFYKPFDSNGYDYVDLGLPSGIKWAAYNVGATKPEEYGGYYAWGETEEKENYSWSTYKWCNGSEDTLTKYCTSSGYGTVDNKTVLDPEDDVAHVKWGGDWRMPTKAEQDELRNNCTWAWATQNGVNGYKVTGPNGNSIFLPAAGYRDGTGVNDRGNYGYCWSGSLYGYESYGAYDLGFDDGINVWSNFYRYFGQSVRPVSK